jgi:hypothetical protein
MSREIIIKAIDFLIGASMVDSSENYTSDGYWFYLIYSA